MFNLFKWRKCNHKLKCNHEWSVLKEWEIKPGAFLAQMVGVLVCSKCGAVKTFNTGLPPSNEEDN